MPMTPPESLFCKAALVKTRACRGACSSYSTVDPRNGTNMQRSCSCCQPLRYTVEVTDLDCEGGLSLRVPVRRATRCSCRPCYQDNSTRDVMKLRDLFTKAAANTPFPLG